MPARSKMDAVVDLARRRGVIRAADLEAVGAPRSYLGRLVANGSLIQVGRGIYVPSGIDRSIHHTLAVVSRRVPRAVVTLLSALRFHGLGSENPGQVWLALPQGHWRPKLAGAELEISWLDESSLEADVEHHEIEGVDVRVYTPERAVVECFRFRNKVGLEPALEALRDFIRRNPAGMDRLWDCARRRRATNTMRPYLEALA